MPTKTTTEKRNLAADITAMMIERLEQGVAPWRKPWAVGGLMPTSASTGKPYRGINTLLLAVVADERGYTSNVWTTFKQAKAMGGSVKRGEKGTPVVFFKPIEVADDDAPKGVRKIMLMRSFTVFNIEQTEGCTLPAKLQPQAPLVADADIMRVIDATWDGYQDRPTLGFGGAQAFYSPSRDHIQLPPVDAFHDTAAYAETKFHEMVHSTGHASRLNRVGVEQAAPFGSAVYAKEELVAELGAVMLMSMVGITPTIDNSAAYVKGWLSALQDDTKLIVQAAQAAQKAVDRILGVTPYAETTEEA